MQRPPGTRYRAPDMSTNDDAVLAALEHENFVSAIRTLVSDMADPLVDVRDGIAVLACGLPIRLFNEILVVGPSPSVAVLGEGVERLRALGFRYVVHLRDGADDALLPAVQALGLEPTHDAMPGMAYRPARTPGHAAAGLEIRVVGDEAGLADHIDVIATGFGMDRDMVATIMPPKLLDSAAETVYVGYADGQPVTSGMGFRTGDTIGVYNIATVESARGRGFGAAITGRVIADGLAAGCDVAILQASPMGRPIYERMGFREVVTYRGWIDPEVPEAN